MVQQIYPTLVPHYNLGSFYLFLNNLITDTIQ